MNLIAVFCFNINKGLELTTNFIYFTYKGQEVKHYIFHKEHNLHCIRKYKQIKPKKKEKKEQLPYRYAINSSPNIK